MKKKLSKQTIFTILGILVIAASIPMAVLLVKQRQEIRKEAAATCAGIGGVACTGNPGPGYVNLGQTDDCSGGVSCWGAGAPAAPATPAAPSGGTGGGCPSSPANCAGIGG
ncbi:hypothetical protein MUP50_01335, partial [Patescibacteria group bacterium]|nr:hypothetical protein [Patescibacteria group bacterium]